ETLVNWDKNFTIEYITHTGTKKYYVITSLDDIENAIKMMGTTSVIPSDKLKFVTDVFQPCIAGTLREGVTTQELAEKYKQVYTKETTPKKILETYLTPLYDYGIVDSKENSEDKRQYLYRIVASTNSNTLEFIKSKIIEESNNNDLFVWLGIEEIGRYSNGKGYINVIFDHE